MCGAGTDHDDGSDVPQASRQGDLEKYATHLRQVMEAADWPWPEHVLLHPEKQPRFVHTVEEFMREMLVSSHMDEIVVFPGGIEALGHQMAIGQDAAKAMGWTSVAVPPRARTAYEVLENMAEAGALERVKGKVTYRRRVEDRKEIPAGGKKCNAALTEKWQALKSECPEESKESVYVAEMRLLESEPSEDGLRDKRKSAMATTFRERMHKVGMDVRLMPFWDDFSEGFFFGAGSSAYDLHVDCIPSSNVGSVFAGHKLLAIWSYPNESKAVMKAHGREHFAKPLHGSQIQALEGACCVVLAPPGSVYLFSGANAHTVCNIGFSPPQQNTPPEPSLVVSSYEAFVNLHVNHLRTAAEVFNEADADSEDEDLEDMRDELCEGAIEVQRRLQRGHVREAAAASAAVDFFKANIPRFNRLCQKEKDRELECEHQKLPEPKRQRCDGDSAVEVLV